MTRHRKKPLTQGEKSRMIKARKDCIMKKVEELQNLTELGACLIIPMPDGNFETWPKDSDKLREVFNHYEESLKSQNQKTNQAETCWVTDRLCWESFVGQSCHESSAGMEEGVEEENRFLASDFGNDEEFSGKQLLPLEENWCEMNGLSEACNWLDESYGNNMGTINTESENCSTMFQPLQFSYPEANFASVYDMPQPLQVCYPATLPGFRSSCFESTEFLGSNRHSQPYIQEEGKLTGEALGSTTSEDANTSAVGSWGTIPQVFTQYHADYIGT